MLKVRCFKTTCDHRPFLSKLYVKLGFRHFQRCESTKQPQFNAELAAGDYRFRKSITAGGLQPGVTIRLRYLLQNEYNSRWASGTSSATNRLCNHNVPQGPRANPYVEAQSAEFKKPKSLLFYEKLYTAGINNLLTNIIFFIAVNVMKISSLAFLKGTHLEYPDIWHFFVETNMINKLPTYYGLF